MTITQIFKECNKPQELLPDREILLSHVLKKSKEFILGHPEFKLSKNQISKFRRLWEKRLKHCPLAYLIGHKEFFGLDFYVNKNVLIPRPETEFLVEEAIAEARKFYKKDIIIADIGTGSGCIAIALNKNLPGAEIIGLDISAKALSVAEKNAKQNKTAVSFYRGSADLLKKKKICPNIIAANLPYLDEDKKSFYYRHCPALRYEPAGALFAGRRGLGDYLELLNKVIAFDKLPHAIFLEIGAAQIRTAEKLFTKICGAGYRISINDYGGTAIVAFRIRKIDN